MKHPEIKRRFNLFLSLMLILALILTLITTVFAKNSGPADLLIIGDSISTGYGLANPDADSYGAKLAEALKLSKDAYANLAVDGATSGDLVNGFKDPSAADLLKVHNTVIISIGGNDVMSPFFALAKQALGLKPDASNTDLQAAFASNKNAVSLITAAMVANQNQFITILDAFASNLTAIVTSIKTANPNAKIYIQTIYNPFGGVPGFEMLSMGADTVIVEMNSAISGGAEKGGYTDIDIYAAFKDNALKYTNIAALDIHPNAAGHALIFDTIYNIIAPAESEELTEPAPAVTPQPSVGDPLGDVLYSDIMAHINGQTIPTSVINGKTLVVVEDLAKYGFDVVWNGTKKTLKVELNRGKTFSPITTAKDTQNKPGTFKEKYVYTDIKAYLSGKIVDSYAIDGVTLIDFELLAKYGKISWDENKRELKLTINS